MKRAAFVTGALAAALAAPSARAQIYGPGPGGLIPDASPTAPGEPFRSTINVQSFGNTLITPPIVTLHFAPSHTWVGDLVVTLTSPTGADAHVFARTGSSTAGGFGDSSDLIGPYTFVNGSGLPGNWTAAALASPGPIPAGTYFRETMHPFASPPAADPDTFSAFLGQPPEGTWTLTLQDWANQDSGGLSAWTLDLTYPEPHSAGVLATGAVLSLLRRRGAGSRAGAKCRARAHAARCGAR